MQEFIKELNALAQKHGIAHLLVYGADDQDSFEFRKGLPPEAAHGVLLALSATYAERSAQIVRDRLAATKPVTIKAAQ